MPKSKAMWTIECQEPWEMIKTWYMDGPILIAFHWDLKFNVHINHSYEILGAGMLWKPKEARIL